MPDNGNNHELWVHVTANCTARDDARHRQQLQGFLGFDAVRVDGHDISSQSFESTNPSSGLIKAKPLVTGGEFHKHTGQNGDNPVSSGDYQKVGGVAGRLLAPGESVIVKASPTILIKRTPDGLPHIARTALGTPLDREQTQAIQSLERSVISQTQVTDSFGALPSVVPNSQPTYRTSNQKVAGNSPHGSSSFELPHSSPVFKRRKVSVLRDRSNMPPKVPTKEPEAGDGQAMMRTQTAPNVLDDQASEISEDYEIEIPQNLTSPSPLPSSQPKIVISNRSRSPSQDQVTDLSSTSYRPILAPNPIPGHRFRHLIENDPERAKWQELGAEIPAGSPARHWPSSPNNALIPTIPDLQESFVGEVAESGLQPHRDQDTNAEDGVVNHDPPSSSQIVTTNTRPTRKQNGVQSSQQSTTEQDIVLDDIQKGRQQEMERSHSRSGISFTSQESTESGGPRTGQQNSVRSQQPSSFMTRKEGAPALAPASEMLPSSPPSSRKGALLPPGLGIWLHGPEPPAGCASFTTHSTATLSAMLGRSLPKGTNPTVNLFHPIQMNWDPSDKKATKGRGCWVFHIPSTGKYAWTQAMRDDFWHFIAAYISDGSIGDIAAEQLPPDRFDPSFGSEDREKPWPYVNESDDLFRLWHYGEVFKEAWCLLALASKGMIMKIPGGVRWVDHKERPVLYMRGDIETDI